MNEGVVEERDGMVTFRYERRLRKPTEVVWKAITDPDEVGKWAGSRPDIDLRPGGEYVSYHGEGIDPVVDRIVRVEPPRLFEHTFWVHINPSALVAWELTSTEAGCELVLTHTISVADLRAASETLAAGDSIAVIMSRNGAGWHHLLDLLEASFDGSAVAWSPEMRKDLQDAYAAMLS
ncbi:SRPBCC domain-containing protein [Fodinicola feengrottensis]|uniref:Activator of Hsp90 ATPase homologue 1/2-like C-terminal domain-containing protein n=1 Tax=Fodinicola feengrottensis TaxID=435914 RepID=A0ABN2HL95_9ACTN|nr:SRPBCC domain-containing protein [Fodinicola feengrottensis]